MFSRKEGRVQKLCLEVWQSNWVGKSFQLAGWVHAQTWPVLITTWNFTGMADGLVGGGVESLPYTSSQGKAAPVQKGGKVRRTHLWALLTELPYPRTREG